MKVCKGCGKEKSENSFYNRHRMADGLSPNCKECDKAQVRIWRANNPEKVRICHDKYYKKHKKELNQKRMNYKKTPMVGTRWNLAMYVQRNKKNGKLTPDKECSCCNAKDRQIISFFKDLKDRSILLWVCRPCLHQYKKGVSPHAKHIKRKIDRMLRDIKKGAKQ